MHPADGGNWAWVRPTDDGSVLRICTSEGSLDSDPEVADWYLGRYNVDEDGCVECDEFMTLADALAFAPRIPSPLNHIGEVQRLPCGKL